MSTENNNNEEHLHCADESTDTPPDTSVPESSDGGPVPVIPQLSIALAILLLMFGVTYLGDLESKSPREVTHTEDVDQDTPLEGIPKETPPDLFSGIEVTAKSAFVWDVAQQRALYTKNPDEQLPLASITKLMTALVSYELLDTEKPVLISPEAIHAEGDSGLSDGEVFSFENLTNLTLIGSSNDGAEALAAAAGTAISDEISGEEIFVKAMNVRAEEIGLTKTYFLNPTGLDVSTNEAGAYGSARDIAFLMEYLIINYPFLLEETTKEQAVIQNESGQGHLVENTNDVVYDIDGVIASKTGYTELAGGNLVIAFDAGLNRPIIVTVLGSTQKHRFTDVITLTERARALVAHAGL